MGLSKVSVNRPITVLMAFTAIIIIGLISLFRLPIELMPNTSFGTITIHIGVRGGMPPTEVENLVTSPIEEAVATASHIKNVISTSKEGESTITIEFESGTDMDFAALEVREKFAKVRNKRPKEIERPVIAKYQQSDVPIVILTLSSDKRTPEMLRKMVDETLKEKFQRIEGVANIDIGGGRERKILFEIDQDKLKQYAQPINQVINYIAVNNLNLLLGDLERTKDKYLIRAIGQFETLDDIKEIGIGQSKEGSLLRIKDIGIVKDSFLEPKGFARLNKRPVVSLYIQRETSSNTVKTAKLIVGMVEKIKTELPPDIKLKIISNQAEQIEKAISTVNGALINGAFLAVLILFVFLRNFKSTFIIAASIPIAVIATFIMLYARGISINVMTLSGLALGIGMLVDSSIVVLENIFKYKERGLSDIRAAIIGSEEVVLSIIASTITTIIVFLPIIFVNKKIQLQYSGLALTVTFSLIASLFVAVSLVPMLFSRLSRSVIGRKKIKKVNVKKGFQPGSLLFKIRVLYRGALVILLRYRIRLCLVVFTAFGIALYNFIKLDMDIQPKGESNKFTVFVELPSGAKLEISDAVVKKVEKLFAEMPEVETYSSRVEGWSSKIYITLVPQHRRTKTTAQIIDELRPQVRNFKEAFIYFKEESEGSQKEVTIDLYGYDYKILKELAISIASRFGTIPDFEDVKIRMREGRPEMRVIIDKRLCAMYGLNVKEVADIIHAKMRGLRASMYHVEGKEVEIIARLREEDRDTFDKMKRMTIATPNDEQIFLDQIARFDFELGPSEIWRKDKSRMIQVSATRNISLTKSIEKIKSAIADVEFPAEYYYRFGEDYEELQENKVQLVFALILTIILIYMVLASLFESFYQPFIIMMSVPLAIIGVTLVLKLKGMIVTMGVLIGCIMLGGIVVNNAILLIDSINILIREQGYNTLRAVVLVGQERLRPILMTTLTTVLGLLPMALDKSESAQLWAPLAITVVAGLTSSTVLTLFVVPCIFLIFEDIKSFIIRRRAWIVKKFRNKNKKLAAV
ncbi:efflux RND transporter permease subunit [bacterium]|nr:efflux RND transporter permease subunit [bacterium]